MSYALPEQIRSRGFAQPNGTRMEYLLPTVSTYQSIAAVSRHTFPHIDVSDPPRVDVDLLAGEVPQAEVEPLSVDEHGGGVVVKDGGHVEAGEGVGREGGQEAGLAHAAIAHHHALDVITHLGSDSPQM